MAYFAQLHFGDPLIYAHSHEMTFHHKAEISKIFFPDGRLLMQSIWAEPHDGLILAAGLLWFGLGHRKGLSRFATDARACTGTCFSSPSWPSAWWARSR